MNIFYYSDYACPYCYIGLVRLENTLNSLSISATITLKAFQLDPNAPQSSNSDTISRFALKYGISKESAARQIENIDRLGRELGLDISYAKSRFTNTFNAHRLTKFAKSVSSKMAHQLSMKLYKAYFCDSFELADFEILTSLAVSVGLDEGRVKEFLKGDEFANEVRADLNEAAMLGVRAVPFFIIGRYAVSGAKSENDFAKTIQKALDDEILG